MKRTYLLTLLPLLLFSFTQKEIEEFDKQSYEALNNDGAIKAIYEGSLEQLENIFSDDNLAILAADELRLLRNMIFAQYAYAFKSKGLQEWFSKFDWYEPLSNDVTDYLTWIDTFNISKIRMFESAHKKDKEINPKDEDLVGIWHASPMVAAGYNDLLYFFPDHTFRIDYNQMDWSKRLTSMSGNWSIKTNALILEVTEKSTVVGGEIVEGYASCASDFAIEGGEGKKVAISPSETYTYPISDLDIHDLGLAIEKTMTQIRIGTFNWWKFSEDPYVDMH